MGYALAALLALVFCWSLVGMNSRIDRDEEQRRTVKKSDEYDPQKEIGI